jgi:hypothetical protein
MADEEQASISAEQPPALRKFICGESAKLANLIKEAGIKLEQ